MNTCFGQSDCSLHEKQLSKIFILLYSPFLLAGTQGHFRSFDCKMQGYSTKQLPIFTSSLPPAISLFSNPICTTYKILNNVAPKQTYQFINNIIYIIFLAKQAFLKFLFLLIFGILHNPLRLFKDVISLIVSHYSTTEEHDEKYSFG